MLNVTVAVGSLLLIFAGVLSCAGSQTSPEVAPSPGPAPQPPAEPSASPTEPESKRPELTAEACEASGGAVVGDIGDGAVHRPEYRCPSGAQPSGTIRAAEGGPIGVEGSVCCPK
jgi:hypothetical protein